MRLGLVLLSPTLLARSFATASGTKMYQPPFYNVKNNAIFITTIYDVHTRKDLSVASCGAEKPCSRHFLVRSSNSSGNGDEDSG